jgi:thiol-disulfide isomerase/thioredoxin
MTIAEKIIISSVLLINCAFAHSQNTITGTFSGLANHQINLIGFEGFDTYSIDSVKTNEKGVFSLSYGKNDFGMGYLSAEDDKPFFVVLNGETIKLKGDAFALPETIEIIESEENKLFEQYASEHPRREQALSAWDYLEKIYASDSLFAVQKVPKQAIAYEKQRIKTEDSLFLASLDAETYVSWYLPVRKLVSSVSTIAQYRTEEIPTAIAAFRNLDYTDKQLYKSGLLRDAIESHYWLIENSGRSLDSVYIEMNLSIDRMIDNLIVDEKKLNEITEYLFKVFEKRSLFGASEYLAIKLLNEQSCTINNDFAAQLESYRAMKKGNTAPDIVFSGDVLKSGSVIKTPNRLSDIQSAYKVVIFGASWCPKCADELRQLLPLYEKWKAKDIEVIFISLDTDKALFKAFSSIIPFISMCDYKKWDTQSVNDYYIFATPTMFLLDNNQKIILRPKSVKQIDAWVDYAIPSIMPR